MIVNNFIFPKRKEDIYKGKEDIQKWYTIYSFKFWQGIRDTKYKDGTKRKIIWKFECTRIIDAKWSYYLW